MMATESEQKQKPEYIKVQVSQAWPYKWSTGKVVGRVYTEAYENKRLVAPRCPSCRQFVWPPVAVCGRCKVEIGEDWGVLPDTGTVLQYTYLVVPMWDPHYGRPFTNPYANAMIRLDCEEEIYLRHFLEETDKEKLKVGIRVKAVWKEDKADRGRGLADILYFREMKPEEEQ